MTSNLTTTLQVLKTSVAPHSGSVLSRPECRQDKEMHLGKDVRLCSQVMIIDDDTLATETVRERSKAAQSDAAKRPASSFNRRPKYLCARGGTTIRSD